MESVSTHQCLKSEPKCKGDELWPVLGDSCRMLASLKAIHKLPMIQMEQLVAPASLSGDFHDEEDNPVSGGQQIPETR